MKCKELMVGDWIADNHGCKQQVTVVGDDYAYATFEGNEADPWEFNDKDEQPMPIEITHELLKANGWVEHSFPLPYGEHFSGKEENGHYIEWKQGTLSMWLDYQRDNDGVYSDIVIPVKYVHQLQQVLRLVGLTDLANDFRI